jgi:hypothetical protein
MRKFKLLPALAAAVVVMAVVPALGLAGPPAFNGHFSFTSAPYADGWCGIDGTSVDTVRAHFLEDASGASIENLNLVTTFTSTASGKSMEIHIARVSKSDAFVDNGDGTETLFVTNNGLQSWKIPNGPMLVRSVGSITFAITFDAATGEFLSFEVVEEHGQFPPGCEFIIEALT